MFRCFILLFLVISLLSCQKSDFTKEDTFIHVFESNATIAKQTYDDGILALTKDGNIPVVYSIDKEGAKVWRKKLDYLLQGKRFLH